MVQTFVNFLKEAKMVRVVIMGGPGSGKSTYSEYIIRHFGIKHIYPGGLLRKEIDKGGPDGQKIKNLLDQGKFAPNDIVLKLIRKEVASATKGYVLDGYPRYMQQVRDMEKFGIGYDVVVFLDVDKEAMEVIAQTPKLVAHAIRSFRFRDALSEAMKLARAGNKYLADSEPWKLVKTDPERVKTIMNIAMQITANLAIVFEPFMPHKSADLATMINLNLPKWNEAGDSDLIKKGHQINKPQILFKKIEDAQIDEQITKLKEASKKPSKFPPMKDEITFDEFMKMDIRVGTITAAEKVEKADKLLKLTVDTGIDTRTVVSGIAEHYNAEDIVGQKVSVLLNLAPRKIRGVESQGMILMAETEEGELAFVSPTKDLEAGNTIR